MHKEFSIVYFYCRRGRVSEAGREFTFGTSTTKSIKKWINSRNHIKGEGLAKYNFSSTKRTGNYIFSPTKEIESGITTCGR